MNPQPVSQQARCSYWHDMNGGVRFQCPLAAGHSGPHPHPQQRTPSQPPVSLADELRKMAKRLPRYTPQADSDAQAVMVKSSNGYWIMREVLLTNLQTLLSQHAQPEAPMGLTEEQAMVIAEELMAQNMLDVTCVQAAFVIQRALLTSPVPPLTWQHLSHAFTIANDFRNDDDEHYFTVMLNALNSISREGMVDPAAPKGLEPFLPNNSNPTAANPPPAPPVQELASDDDYDSPERRARRDIITVAMAVLSGAPPDNLPEDCRGIVAHWKPGIVATAAKQARDEALEEAVKVALTPITWKKQIPPNHGVANITVAGRYIAEAIRALAAQQKKEEQENGNS